MTFTDWYKEKYQDEWHEDYALIYSFAHETITGYEAYCEENNVNPVWNG